MTKRKQKKMQQLKEKKRNLFKWFGTHPCILPPRESNRSVVSVQVCVELTRPGNHFIFLQMMARSIHALICEDNDNNISFKLMRKRGKLINT